jgi:hypothetical protein
LSIASFITNDLESYNIQKNWLSLWIVFLGAFVAVIGSAGVLYAQVNADWAEPFPPFRIAGTSTMLVAKAWPTT